MKNFTNNFKQFTSRLSARWLIMALMMLVGTSSAWAETLYLDLSQFTSWEGDGAVFRGYFWGGSGSTQWANFTETCVDHIYSCTIPGSNRTNVIIIRAQSGSTGWNNEWNRAGGGDLTITANNNSYIVTGWASGKWGSIQITPTKYTVSKGSAENKVKLSNSESNFTYTLYKGDTPVSNSGTTGNGKALEWAVSESGTYKVKAKYTGSTCDETEMNDSYNYSPCTPATSITSATLKNGTISLVGDFTTCGKQYHGFQWRIKGQEWCPENDPQSYSDYIIKNSDVDGEDTDTFTPTAGNTYEFRTYIYGSPWIYSSEIKEVEVPCPTINAPTFSESSKIACKNVAFNLNDLFPRTDSGAGTLEWYKNDGTKVADPTSVSIDATKQYYAVLKDGLCSSANSSNVTVNIYTPVISNIQITPFSYGITVKATIAGSDLQSMIVECIEKGGDWVNAKKCNQSLKGSGNATCSIDGLVAGSDYQVRISANTKTCSELFTYSAVQDVKTTCDEIPDAPDIITSGVVCPNTNITLSDYNNGIVGVKWYSNPECTTPASATVSISSNKMYYARIEDGGCASDASILSLTLYPTPQTPVVTFSPNPVAQNKPTTLTVGEYNGTLNNYTLYKDGDSQGACAASQEITIGQAGEYDYRVVATSKACPNLTATSETVTLEVQEAGAKIVQLGDLVLYTNDDTDFVPMYVQKDGIVDIDGATKVEGYTWEFSENGTSDWDACSTGYVANGVGMDNGGEKCNNWRANKVGYYRCMIKYDKGSQPSNTLRVTQGTNIKTNKQHIGAQRNLPIISVNTGGNSFPSEPANGYPSADAADLKAKISVDVKIFNADGTLHYDRKARMNYRGSSSLNFKKKSYAFVTGKEKTKNDKGDVDTGKANLFGLSDGAEDKDWVLYAATPDPTMMRNRLTFDLYQQMRPNEWGVNSKYVELVINGEYMGVYVLMDKITENDKRINITAGDGFIVKFDKTDVADRYVDGKQSESDEKTFKTERTGRKGISTYGTTVDQLFEIEYPEKEDTEDAGGNWTSVVETIKDRFEKFETALANKDYTAVRTLIDYDSWADWFILTEFIKNQDGFRASCIFVYNGGKIEARPLWDQELSFDNRTRMAHGSNSVEDLMIQSDGVYSDCFPAPFWFYGKNATFGTCGNNNGNSGSGTRYSGYLLADPCFVSLVKSKWATYQTGILSAKNISDMVSVYATELGNAQTREESRWPYDEGTRGTTKNGLYIGYYAGEGDKDYFGYSASKGSITTWASDRSTALDANSGLGKAINDLNGEALIFTINPSTIETSPWQQNVITVNAPKGYEYEINFSELTNVGTEVKENGDSYTFKVPRPNGWGTAGNGTAKSVQYTISATIDAEGENACGTQISNTATSVVTLKDVTENCSPEVKP